MELQPEDILPDLKGLVFTYGAFCKADSPGRKVECLTVPVKNNAFFWEAERIRHTWRGFNLKPADFFLRITINTRSKCAGNELCPKANSKNWDVLVNCITNKLFFRSKPWQAGIVIYAHGTAHHNDEIEIFCLWQSMILEETSIADIGTLIFQPLSHAANAFERYMLKYVNFHLFLCFMSAYRSRSQ